MEDLGFEIAHFGVNTNSEKEAVDGAMLFQTLFGLNTNPARESAGALFTGNEIEWMKAKGYGDKGHISIATNDVPKAMAYLESKGIKFFEESISRLPDGRINVIYSDLEVCGFAVHLAQK